MFKKYIQSVACLFRFSLLAINYLNVILCFICQGEKKTKMAKTYKMQCRERKGTWQACSSQLHIIGNKSWLCHSECKIKKDKDTLDSFWGGKSSFWSISLQCSLSLSPVYLPRLYCHVAHSVFKKGKGWSQLSLMGGVTKGEVKCASQYKGRRPCTAWHHAYISFFGFTWAGFGRKPRVWDVLIQEYKKSIRLGATKRAQIPQDWFVKKPQERERALSVRWRKKMGEVVIRTTVPQHEDRPT